MASWQTESPSLPAWSDLSNQKQLHHTSLRDVLETSQASRSPSISAQQPVTWADLLRQPASQDAGAGPSAPAQPLRAQPIKQQSKRDGDPLMAQAIKSKPDFLTGQIRCLGCGRVCIDHKALAQHLKDKHGGVNSPTAPRATNAQTGTQSSRTTTSFSLADVLMASRTAKKAPVKKPESKAGGLSLTSKQLRNVRGLVKAYPTKAELAQAIRGKLGTPTGNKKLSRLKRVIVRERTDKAVTLAIQAAAAAHAAAAKAEAARDAVEQSLKASELKLQSEKGGGSVLEPTLITQVQVLEMALAEAERRVAEANRKAKQAEDETAKAAEERAKAWKVSDIADADKDDSEASPAEALPGISCPQTATDSSPVADANDQDTADSRMIGNSTQGTAAEQSPKARSSKPPVAARPQPRSSREEVEDLPDIPSQNGEMLEGLQGFENVLASWLHDASEKASAAMAHVVDEDEDEDEGDIEDEASANSSTKDQEDVEEDVSEADSEGLGPDGWDDVLSAWMTNAGVLNTANHAEPAEVAPNDRHVESYLRAPPPPDLPALSRPRSALTSLAATPKAQLSPGSTTPHAPTDLLQLRPSTDPVISKQPSGFDALISPTTRSTTTPSPRSAESTTPNAASLANILVGTRSDVARSLSRQGSTTPGSWRQDRTPSRAGDPLPLLADVLAGGQLSHDALLDLRVSLADSLSIRSDDEDSRGLFNARVAGGGAMALPEFPTRHSEAGTSASGQRLPPLRHLHSWGPWSSSGDFQSGRWQEGQAPRSLLEAISDTPGLFGLDTHAARGGRASMPPPSKAADQRSKPIDLFGGASNVGMMADLGLASLHSVDSHVHGSKLYHNVLTAAQRKMLDDLPAPRNEPAPWEPPLARLPSITRSMTKHAQSGSMTPPSAGLADHASRASLVSGLLAAAASSDDEDAPPEIPQVLRASHRSTSLPSSNRAAIAAAVAQQASPQLPGARHRQHHPQQQFFGHPQPQPLHPADHHWRSQEHARPGFPFDAGLQGFSSTSPMPFQDAPGMFPDAHLPQNQPGFGHPSNRLATRRVSADAVRLGQMGELGGINPMQGLNPLEQFQMGPAAGLPHQQGFMGHQGMLQGHMQQAGIPEMPMIGGLPMNDMQLRTLLSSGSMSSGMFPDKMPPQLLSPPDWNHSHVNIGPAFGDEAPPNVALHEFCCDVCRVTCCGMTNFQQHCNSKKHLRKVAAAGAAAIPDSGSPGPGDEPADELADGGQSTNPTYVGLQAQCRTYCKQVISTDLNRVVVDLLQNLLFWQERSKAMNMHNAAKKKRLVSGLREVAKAIKLKKARTVIVTPNIEQIETEGGLDDLLSSILDQANESDTPVVFALSRKKLGQVFGCRKKMSAIAILDYSGAEDLFKEMEKLAEQGRAEWENHHQEELKAAVQENQETIANNASIQAEGERPALVLESEVAAAASPAQKSGADTGQNSTVPANALPDKQPASSQPAATAHEDGSPGAVGAKIGRQWNVQAPQFVPRT